MEILSGDIFVALVLKIIFRKLKKNWKFRDKKFVCLHNFFSKNLNSKILFVNTIFTPTGHPIPNINTTCGVVIYESSQLHRRIDWIVYWNRILQGPQLCADLHNMADPAKWVSGIRTASSGHKSVGKNVDGEFLKVF